MGFSTLLDVVGSVILGGLLLLTIIKLNGRATENRFIFGNDRILQRDVSNLAQLLESDFRKMGFAGDNVVVDDTVHFILNADTSSIKFLADINDDNSLETVTYYLGPTSELANTPNPRDRILYRKINNETPLKISTNAVKFNFQYFDTFDSLLTLPISDTRLIESMLISVKMEDNSAYDQKYSTAYWQQVRLTSRNLRKR